jgi:hypothetical protein
MREADVGSLSADTIKLSFSSGVAREGGIPDPRITPIRANIVGPSCSGAVQDTIWM